jgi:hypothetical protein
MFERGSIDDEELLALMEPLMALVAMMMIWRDED